MANKKMSRRPPITRMQRVEMMQTGRKPKGRSAGIPSTRKKAK